MTNSTGDFSGDLALELHFWGHRKSMDFSFKHLGNSRWCFQISNSYPMVTVQGLSFHPILCLEVCSFFPYSLKKSLLPILTKAMKSSQNFLMNDPSFGEHVLKRHVCYFSVKTTELYVLNIPGPHLGFRMQEGGDLTVPGTFWDRPHPQTGLRHLLRVKYVLAGFIHYEFSLSLSTLRF